MKARIYDGPHGGQDVEVDPRQGPYLRLTEPQLFNLGDDIGELCDAEMIIHGYRWSDNANAFVYEGPE